MSDHQAKAFVSHGLAKLVKPDVLPKNKQAPAKGGQNPLDFTPPAGDRAGSGSSSQAGPALRKKTVKKSVSGKKKARKKRAKKKQKTS